MIDHIIKAEKLVKSLRGCYTPESLKISHRWQKRFKTWLDAYHAAEIILAHRKLNYIETFIKRKWRKHD